jgi:hypothetical protein
VGVLDAKLRAAAAALAPALDDASNPESSDPLDPVALRLQANGVRLLACNSMVIGHSSVFKYMSSLRGMQSGHCAQQKCITMASARGE